jgi:hypothetical protein
MSREDIMELRRGELSPAEAAVWLARAQSLSTPTAPEDGDLPPSGIGWLLSVHPVGRRAHPRLALAVLCCALGGALVAGWADLLAWHRPPLIVAVLLGALIPLAVTGLVELATRYAVHRFFARAARPQRLAEVVPGRLVCLTGVITAPAPVPTLFRGVPAVLFRDSIGGADEVRGIDFDLELNSDERVRVCVRRAVLVDPPTRTQEAPACGPVYAAPAAEGFGAHLCSALVVTPSPLIRTLGVRHESSVGPGDRVEVVGVLRHELAPEAAIPFARNLPTRFVLRAGERHPLLVRREARRRD